SEYNDGNTRICTRNNIFWIVIYQNINTIFFTYICFILRTKMKFIDWNIVPLKPFDGILFHHFSRIFALIITISGGNYRNKMMHCNQSNVFWSTKLWYIEIHIPFKIFFHVFIIYMVGHVEHLFDTTFVQLFCVVAVVLSTKVSTMDNIKIMGFVDRAIDVDTY